MNSVIIKKSYPKIPEGGFSSLTCFYEQLVNSLSDRDFFRIISENVMPLIQQSSQIKPLYEKWIEENETHEKKWQTAKSKATKTLEETYHSIHVKLSKKKLLDEPEISSRITYIESLIQFKSSSKNFRYFPEFSNHLKLLFHQILKQGELSIIQPFAEIEKLGEIPFQNAVGHTNKSLIHSHVFDPLLEELSNLEKITNWKDLTKPWAAFNKLLRAKRAWNSQEQDFKNNSLIEEYVEWKDMDDLKDPTSSKDILFFKREKYLEYIEILLNEILVHQDTSALPPKESKALRDGTIPKSIYLGCQHNQLFLSLFEEADHQYSDKILLHKFNEVSSPRDFFEDLISKGVGNTVDCENGGGTVSKHILDVKFPPIFTDLFIIKASTYKAELKANPITVKDISKTEADKLFKEIDRLKSKNEQASKKKSKQKRTSK